MNQPFCFFIFLLGATFRTDLIAMLVSIIFYVVLMAVFDSSKMIDINNLWEDVTSLEKRRSTNEPNLLQALASVRKFIKAKSRVFPCLHSRLELGSDLGEAAVTLLKLSL